MSSQRGSTQGWRHLAEIRFTDVRVASDRVEFDAVGVTGDRIRFSIDDATLRRLADGPRDATLAVLFAENKDTIHGVAARVFDAGVRDDPIRLQPQMFPGV